MRTTTTTRPTLNGGKQKSSPRYVRAHTTATVWPPRTESASRNEHLPSRGVVLRSAFELWFLNDPRAKASVNASSLPSATIVGDGTENSFLLL